MSKEEVALELSHIVFIGRTFDEYMAMFNLSNEDLIGRKILDCPAGGCSFTAIANQLGADVTATDIAYYHDYSQLEQKGYQDILHVIDQMEKAQGNYVWDYFRSIESLKKHRMQALTDCAADMIQSPDRYVPAILPTLPFHDKQFDMTLSAHFLFMYADRLDYTFHVDTIRELIRVTKQEIRIFPFVDLSSAKYEHMNELVDEIQRQGFTTEEIRVPYEFQKGTNSMLRMSKM